MQAIELEPIGLIHSGYKEKFGIPRQPGLVHSVRSTLELLPPYGSREAVSGLEMASHIWLLFLFSECVGKGWKPRVRPPRLGGNQRLGVFATRSPFRPNPIGLSPVRLDAIRFDGDRVLLDISGADLLDQTPVLDIKPYLPYSDRIDDATFALAEQIELLDLPVIFAPAAERRCDDYGHRLGEPLRRQIEELLRCDPRPAYQKQQHDREYGIRLHDLNIRWRIDAERIEVLSITPAED
ncbi:tRNA (N6-threonylcarbamoyladenosine(37)-N6)-methyltransferase TrmO [Marinobacterium nitratireducens]|uniref:tRNA (N6-threonylcarbamoyladenosine(37)-N6)-methyltransferase TrmO n=1 Tax=Marinobacterium nitratireducens TaxID=518897 RepID=A0A918DYI6_9GAMM|nr:tRNA (N6-threonylcarbamoyladenosine(37)-N6)-methyltransferase TrmO [Marinobacterium nitratireducens]GGO88939.1 tRNA (N6-threonylcarbamoyladenosine(37)-N6)-methyltransferase TrmO [Marinobacterium nitratireducens]